MSKIICGIANRGVEFPRVVPCSLPGNEGEKCLMCDTDGFNKTDGLSYFAYHSYRYATNSGHPYYVTGIGEWAVSFEFPIGTLVVKSGFHTREGAKAYVKGIVNNG